MLPGSLLNGGMILTQRTRKVGGVSLLNAGFQISISIIKNKLQNTVLIKLESKLDSAKEDLAVMGILYVTDC
jgi:hypothetical protein